MSVVQAGRAVITAVGAVTPVGSGVVESCASIRAGISRLAQTESYAPMLPPIVEDEPAPLQAAAVLDPESGLSLEERLLSLGLAALRDLAQSAGLGRADYAGLPLFVALPPAEREGVERLDDAAIASEFRRRIALDLVEGGVSARGHVASAHALQAAMRALEGGAPRCIVLAADSYLCDPVFAWLDRAYRLRSERNVDGFIPGEAAAAVLLERPEAAAARGGQPLGSLDAIAIADEPSPISSEASSTGEGLSTAIRKALEISSHSRSGWTICDLNGESYRGQEWGIVSSRLAEVLTAPEVWHPADCIGDVGAASGVLHLAVAIRAFSRGYAPEESALLWCAGDDASRAASIVSGPGAQGMGTGE